MRRKRKEAKETKIFIAILILSVAIIAGLLFISNYEISQKRKQLLSRINELKQEIEYLEDKNISMEQDISKSQDDEYWEAKIREHGYKKPGETVVVVKKEGGEEQVVKETDTEENNDILRKLLGQVIGLFE